MDPIRGEIPSEFAAAFDIVSSKVAVVVEAFERSGVTFERLGVLVTDNPRVRKMLLDSGINDASVGPYSAIATPIAMLRSLAASLDRRLATRMNRPAKPGHAWCMVILDGARNNTLVTEMARATLSKGGVA
jgi:hypothetical protein